MLRQLVGGGSYLSCSQPVLAAGIGSANAADITISWPSGVTSRHRVAANSRVTIVEPPAGGQE